MSLLAALLHTPRDFAVGNLLTGRAVVTEELEVENYSLLACSCRWW